MDILATPAVAGALAGALGGCLRVITGYAKAHSENSEDVDYSKIGLTLFRSAIYGAIYGFYLQDYMIVFGLAFTTEVGLKEIKAAVRPSH